MSPNSPAPIELPHKAYMLPQAIPMWPPAWWTWLAVAIIVLTIFTVILLSMKRRQKRTYRREAVGALKQAEDTMSDKELVVHCHEMIRRCLVSENKLSLAALPVTQLIDVLDQKMPKKQTFRQLGDAFINGPYQGNLELTSSQRADIVRATRLWIRKHHA